MKTNKQQRKPMPYELQELERRISRLERRQENALAVGEQKTLSPADAEKIRNLLEESRLFAGWEHKTLSEIVVRLADSINRLRAAFCVYAKPFDNKKDK